MERPILFSAPMVQAILEGRKSMTRRVVKDWLLMDYPNYFDENNSVMNKPPHKHDDGKWYYEEQTKVDSTSHSRLVCPYGIPGDRLWVRETWAILPQLADGSLVYRATDWRGWLEYETEIIKWRPSIHMPRWASRITLEITDVRVERLQEVTNADIGSEGACKELAGHFQCNDVSVDCAEECWAPLWDSINAKKHPWESNPWVWAISFKRL